MLRIIVWGGACAFFCTLGSVQVASAQNPHSQVRHEIKHDTSPSLRSMKPVARRHMLVAGGHNEGAENREERSVVATLGGHVKDTVAQTQAAAPHAPVIGLNFDGITAPAGRAVPDTNGAVGATQYFQWVNTQFEVFDKTSGASVYGPVDASTIWAGFPPCNSTDDDDVVVVYDKIANRWVLEQHVAPTTGANYQCIAVSTTPDATSPYHRYVFSLPSNFPDYPKISVWPDAYYLTINEESNTTGAALGAYVCALDRANMLAGTSATAQCFQLASTYNSLLPADLDGSILPPAGAPNYLMNVGTNSLNLWQFHVDWVNPSNSAITGPTNIPVAAFTNGCKASSLCVPQQGTTQLVDGIGDRLMFRLAYRHFADGHESLVATHSINSAIPIAARWYEVQSPASNPYVFQQGTFAPDSNNRWMGSIAMDQMGDIGLGYSVSSATMFPAIRYTARLQSDPLNTMEAESSIIEGTGSEVGSNRWGDYSAMTVDPVDDCTFWFTSEYFPVSGDYNWHTRIASFSFPPCTSNPVVTLAPNGLYFGAVSVGTSSAPESVTLTNQQSVPLNVTNVAASGAYTETDNCVSSSPIPAGGTCSISITFRPATSGTLTGQVTVTDDAPGSFQVVNMTGIGSAPAVTLAPTSLKFAGVLIGMSSGPKGVKLTNSGAGPLIISSIAASGGYSETDNCVSSSPLVGGASCNITVTFSPTVTGNLTGAITIYDNGVNGAPHRIPVSGSGLVTIAVSPVSLVFPLTTVGNTSAAQFVTVTNNAATAQNILWAAGGDFAAVPGGVTPCGSALNAASACTLSVTFSPTTNGLNGVVKGALAVRDTASGILYNPQSVNLGGTASGGPATNPLTFSPASLNFGNVAIGATKSGTAQIMNATTSSITLSSLTASGDYGVTPSGAAPCTNGLVLAARAKCGFTVSLTSTSGGSIVGSVTAVDNASSGPTVQTFNLAATAFWPITLSPVGLNFGAVTVGTTSAPLQVTVTNYTTGPVTLNSFVASGDYTTVSLGATPCTPGMILSASGKCTFGVTFSPTVAGTITGAATVSHSAPNSPQVVSLSGSGH
jgi:hypothetical protein